MNKEELVALLPHDQIPIRYPDELRHLTIDDEARIDELAKEYATHYALAAIASLSAAEDEAKDLALFRYMANRAMKEDGTDLRALREAAIKESKS